METATRAIYVLFGLGALAAGIAGLLVPGLVQPDVRDSGLATHLTREQGAAFVFIGFMLLWCWRHFESRRPVHFGLLLFTALFAGIHWAGSYWNVTLLAANTIPVVIFAITAPWKNRER